jgi:hypothetical protein
MKNILCIIGLHKRPKRNKYFPAPPLCARKCGAILFFKDANEHRRARKALGIDKPIIIRLGGRKNK